MNTRFIANVLPLYSLDLNPIEESFSAGMHLLLMVYSISYRLVQ